MTDDLNKLSSKRLIAIILTLCLVVIVIADLVFKRTITEFIFNGFVDALIWSMGFIGAEKVTGMMPEMLGRRSGRGRKPTRKSKSYENDESYEEPVPDDEETEDDMR